MLNGTLGLVLFGEMVITIILEWKLNMNIP